MLPWSNAWFSLLVDVSLKSWLLGLFAALALAVLRIRDVNTRHRVWTVVLIGMLSLPFLVRVTPRVPLPEWMTVRMIRADAPATIERGATLSTAAENKAPKADDARATLTVPPWESNGFSRNAATTPIEDRRRAAVGTETLAQQHEVHTIAESAEKPSSIWEQVFRILAIVHVGVATFLLARIALGLFLAQRMLSLASKVTETLWPVPANVSLLQSEQACVPVTFGFIRPKVILPIEWNRWSEQKIQSALSHELAHVRRGDWLVALLAEVNRAFHWHNPLAWYLRRQLAELAEHSCDDAVIESSGDRAEYAQHLLEIASSLTPVGSRYRLPQHSITMARRPAVEVRIDAILDDSRPLARRLGWIGATGMLALAVPAILIAAGLAPDTVEESDDNRVSVAAETDAKTDSARPFVYAGQVLTPDGQPAAGAEIRLVYWYSDQSQTPRDAPDAVADEDGRFRFELQRSEFYHTGDSVPPWHWASLAATKEGYGLAWANSLAFEQTGIPLQEMRQKQDFTGSQRKILDRIANQRGPLRLASDRAPISGKVVTTEGQPVPNVTVRLLDAYTGEDDTLSMWHEARQAPRADFYSTRKATPKHLYGPVARKLIPPVKTNAKGEFTMGGLGDGRLVRLLFESPTIESNGIFCRTEAGERIQIDSSRQAQAMHVFGSNVSHVVTPSKPITGVVRDKATAKPVAGVLVSSMEMYRMVASGATQRIGSEFSRAVTDQDGRYTLTGLPNAEGNPIRFVPPADLSLLSRMSPVDTSGSDAEPVELNTELVSGVLVAGRVVDRDTGMAVSGQIGYMKANTGESLGLIVWPESPIGVEDTRSDTAGEFQIVVPPGKGYLTFQAFDDTYEKRAYRPKNASTMAANFVNGFFSSGGPEKPEFHAIAEFDLAADAVTHRVQMQVRRAPLVSGTVTGPDGKEVEGHYAGRDEYPRWWPLDNGRFTVADYNPKFARRLTFVSSDRKLSGTIVLKGEVTDTITITLQPSSTLKGRLVGEQGDPVPEITILAGNFVTLPAPRDDASLPEPSLPLPEVEGGQGSFVTDEDGRFTIEGLVGGSPYRLLGMEMTGGVFSEGSLQGDLAHDLVIETDRTLDLGDVQLKKPDFEKLQRQFEEAERERTERTKDRTPEESAPEVELETELDRAAVLETKDRAVDDATAVRVAAAIETGEPARESAPAEMRVVGKVRKPNGEPLAGARLYWPQTTTPQPMKMDDMRLQHVATSAPDGSFEAELIFPSLPWARDVPLIAVADGFGMAWTDVSPKRTPEQLTFTMHEEFPISGRLLSTEGDPVAGASVGLSAILTDSSGSVDKLLTAWKSEWRSSSMRIDKVLHVGVPLLGEIIGNKPTDSQGRFTIQGLGKEHAVWINVSSPSIGNRTAVVITRDGFEPETYNQAALAQAGEMELMRRQTPQLFANDLAIVAEPGKVIAGRVTEIGSAESVEGVLVHVSVGQGDAIMSTTDVQGRYQLAGIPTNIDEVLISFRKPDTRYLPRTLATKLTPGLQPMEFNAGLAKGIILKGRVTETETGAPVTGGIRFAPLEDNPWKDKPGYDDYQRSRVMESVGPDGNFEFVSIPGPGVLLMQVGPTRIEIGGQRIKPHRKGRLSEEDRKRVRIDADGECFYTSANGLERFENGMKVVDIPENVEQYEANVTVDRGLDLDLAILDEDGNPLSGAMVCGVTESWPITYVAAESSIRIYGLDPAYPRKVIVYHSQRHLAGTLTIRGVETEPMVAKLQPTRTLAGRAVDMDGDPLVGAKVDFAWSDDTSREFQRQLNMTREPVTTDEGGRFRIEGAMPGVFRLTFSLDNKRYSTDQKWDDLRTIASTRIADGGAEAALGDITVRPR